MDPPGDVAIADKAEGGARVPHLLDELGVARTVEDADGDLAQLQAFGQRQRLEVVGRRRIEIDQAFGKARPDGDLVHIDGGHLQQAAALGDGKHRERIGKRLGAQGRAFHRIDGKIDLKARCA